MLLPVRSNRVLCGNTGSHQWFAVAATMGRPQHQDFAPVFGKKRFPGTGEGLVEAFLKALRLATAHRVTRADGGSRRSCDSGCSSGSSISAVVLQWQTKVV
mmetsp:Transcript_13898/g.44369  ORF Transcript_13898/g.44369 Transcript_13898/m.44369 type:complete len:101 (-) Transcript_13898:32-334(-)